MNDEEIEKYSAERQKFQMHKEGYKNIVEAIKSIPETTIEIPPMDMKETNEILSKLVDKINEPICVKLNLQ